MGKPEGGKRDATLCTSVGRKWDVLDKTVLPSAYEQMTSGNRVVDKLSSGGMSATRTLFQKVVVLTLTCPKCGRLRVKRTRLFN